MSSLAILGGNPLLEEPQTRWTWPPDGNGSRQAIAAYVSRGDTFSPRGSEGVIGECEQALADRNGLPLALLCSSGTMALYCAFAALGLGTGDELICPAVTFHATASPALHLGTRVVLVDVDPETGNLDLDAAAAAISPRTAALVTNAMWGHPLEQEAVRTFCDRHGIAWIEDVSHAHFAVWKGSMVGTWGDVACMSLGAEKILTGGLAGALLTRHRDVFERAVLTGNYLFRSHQAPKGDICDPALAPFGRSGYGLKLSCHPLAAVAILHQVRHCLDGWIAERNASLRELREGLGGLEGLHVPPIRSGVESLGGWYGFKPWVDTKRLGISRERLSEALAAEGVEIKAAGSPGLHRLGIFSGLPLANGRTPQEAPYSPEEFSAAETYHAGLLSVPTCTGRRDAQRKDEIIAAFHKVWEHLDELR